jgi:hypothetical protein
MLAASDPNMIIAGLAVGGLVFIGMWRLIAWVREAPLRPDPWDADVEKKLSDPDTPQVCPHCLTEQPPTAWFCACCGSAVGPYNNLMPYVQVFSEGEVFRNSGSRHLRNRPLVKIGYTLIMLGTFSSLFWSSPTASALFILLPLLWLASSFNPKRPPGPQEPAREPS